jgi:hypothetical protein
MDIRSAIIYLLQVYKRTYGAILIGPSKGCNCAEKDEEERKCSVWLGAQSVNMAFLNAIYKSLCIYLGAYWLHNNLTAKEIGGGSSLTRSRGRIQGQRHHFLLLT